MSDDQDFPYLAEDRRNFRKQAAVGVVAVLFGIGFLALKCSQTRERERDRRGQMALNQALHDYRPSPVTPTAPTAVVDEPAVELELVRGASRADVVGATIALGDGRALQVAVRPQWTYSDANLSLSYRSSLRLTRGEGTILLGGGDALAELAIVETEVSEADGVAELARSYESTGQVAASAATTLTLLGREVAGKRIVTAGPVIEVAAAAAGKGKQLRVIIIATSGAADPGAVRAAVETVTLAPRPATAELDVTLRGADGDSIGTAAATIGKAFELGGEAMTIAWRKTVRQSRGGMRFEHSPELTVTSIAGAAPTVSLRSGEIGIQVMIAPFAIAPHELAAAIGASVADAAPITRTFGDTPYRGIAGEFQLGELAMHTQAFTFERGGRPFLVMIQSPGAEAERAAKLAEPVVVSVR